MCRYCILLILITFSNKGLYFYRKIVLTVKFLLYENPHLYPRHLTPPNPPKGKRPLPYIRHPLCIRNERSVTYILTFVLWYSHYIPFTDKENKTHKSHIFNLSVVKSAFYQSSAGYQSPYFFTISHSSDIVGTKSCWLYKASHLINVVGGLIDFGQWMFNDNFTSTLDYPTCS